MIKILALLCLATFVASDSRRDNEKNLELYKYDPSDIYSLPADIEDDLPAIVFKGDVMKAKVDKLENYSGNKKYKLDLRTQNGIQVSSVGKLKDDKTFVVSGSYSFTGADGKRYRTRYTADERGYHPITELDLDIPEPQPVGAASNSIDVVEKALFGGPKNRFQFLNQNLNLPARGAAQSGDDYSYAPEPAPAASENAFETYSSHSESGYDYSRPTQSFEPPHPERQYLPSL